MPTERKLPVKRTTDEGADKIVSSSTEPLAVVDATPKYPSL